MDNWRDQIEGTVKDDKTTTRLLDSALVCSLVKFFEELVYDACHDAAKLTVLLILNVRVLHMYSTYCEEFVSEIVDKCHENLVISDRRGLVVILLCRCLAVSARVVFIAHDLKHRQQVLFAKVIHIIIEEVEIQVDDKEGTNALG